MHVLHLIESYNLWCNRMTSAWKIHVCSTNSATNNCYWSREGPSTALIPFHVCEAPKLPVTRLSCQLCLSFKFPWQVTDLSGVKPSSTIATPKNANSRKAHEGCRTLLPAAGVQCECKCTALMMWHSRSVRNVASFWFDFWGTLTRFVVKHLCAYYTLTSLWAKLPILVTHSWLG